MNHKILAIREKIRSFTNFVPPSSGIPDPAYTVYLATCSVLHDFDVQLNAIENQDVLEEEIDEILLEIEKKVDSIVGCYKKRSFPEE